jgi:bifunctional non-homologous end joining protein LigD
MHARLDRGAVRLLTRTGLDWTHNTRRSRRRSPCCRRDRPNLDGELCGVGVDGTTSFGLIQNASDTGKSNALVFFLFDLLHLDGEAVSLRPLKERK